jgi:hypothetical protein
VQRPDNVDGEETVFTVNGDGSLTDPPEQPPFKTQKKKEKLLARNLPGYELGLAVIATVNALC